eukprot:m.1438723 g.1438723  ORF g.1438723 m.1438723 type:complete len:154 (+) comp25093_c0_seq8:741-1202(+)
MLAMHICRCEESDRIVTLPCKNSKNTFGYWQSVVQWIRPTNRSPGSEAPSIILLSLLFAEMISLQRLTYSKIPQSNILRKATNNLNLTMRNLWNSGKMYYRKRDAITTREYWRIVLLNLDSNLPTAKEISWTNRIGWNVNCMRFGVTQTTSLP